MSSLYAILRLAIKGRKEVFRMNEQEKATMNIIEPEGLSSCGADSGTWCGQALTRVLIGMTLMGLTLNVLCLNYILPAIGMVFLLVGLRALRRENAGFKGGYVIAILRTFYITVWMILDTTIYADVLTGTTAAVVLTAVNLAMVLAQVVCLWSGLKALRQKAGFEAKCGAAAALIVWNAVLCALGLIGWSGWITGIIMIVLYIIIMRRLFALAGELDNAGCMITPVPVRVKDWQLVLSLAVLLAAGMACGYAFGGSYPMEWTPLDNSAQTEVQSTKAKLLELGFPEAVLNDLSAEDIASCEGATQILSRTEDKPVNDGREVTTQTGENSYQIDTVYDAKELRLTGVAVRVKQTDGTERWIIFHHFLWTQPIEEGLKFGPLLTVKIENMREQHTAKVIEGTADAPKERVVVPAEKKYGFVAVAAGEGLKSLFTDLGADAVVQGGQTMNPSTDDIIRAVDSVPAEIVFVLPNNKNIIMAAEQAVHLSEEKKLVVVPTKTIPQGISAMLAVDLDAEQDTELATAMTEAASHVRSGQVTYAARDSEFDGKKIKQGEYLSLSEGKLCASGRESSVLKKLVREMVSDDSAFATVIFGEGVTEEQAAEVENLLHKENKGMEISIINGGQPVYYYILSVE